MVRKLSFIILLLLCAIQPSDGRSQTIELEEEYLDLNYVLNQMTIIAERGRELDNPLSYIIRLILVPTKYGECVSGPEDCPKAIVYVAVSEWGEHPTQRLYKLPESYGWGFDSWKDFPDQTGKTTFIVFRMKRKVISTDRSNEWFSEEVYEVRANTYAATMQRLR